MTIRYVSQTATNGYAIGEDTGNGDTKAAPWLSLEHALATASADDTIYINDGTQVPLGGGLDFFSVNTSGLTIIAENAGLVKLQTINSYATRVINLTNTADNTTLNGIEFDANGVCTGLVTTSVGEIGPVTFEACIFTMHTGLAINMVRETDVTINGCTFTAAGSTSTDIVSITGATAGNTGTITITNNTFNVTNFTANRHCIDSETAVAGKSIVVSGNTITCSSAASIGNGIKVSGYASTKIFNNTITANDSGTGIEFLLSATDESDVSHVYGNTITSEALCITIGTNVEAVDANANTIHGALVFDNTLIGVDNGGSVGHGIVSSQVTGCHIFNNLIMGPNNGGIVHKTDTNGLSTGNVIIDITSDIGALYFKGATNSTFAHNLVIFNTGASVGSAWAFKCGADALGIPTDSTGCAYYNNTVYCDTTIDRLVFVGAAASQPVCQSNNYFLDTNGVVTTAKFFDGTTPYATATAWIAGIADTAVVNGEVEIDPEFTDFQSDGTGDYTTSSASLIRSGFVHNITNAIGFNDKGFPAPSPDIACVQTTDNTNNPFHPSNL